MANPFLIAQAAGGVVNTASIFMQASTQKQNIDSKLRSIHAQKAERERRHQINLRVLRRQARKSVASQQGAYIAGGVKLEGSAIDVVNDTLMDLLNAELNKQSEVDFLNEQSAIESASLQFQRSQVDTVAMINAASSLLGSGGAIGLAGVGTSPSATSGPGAPSAAPMGGGFQQRPSLLN